jgi:DNA-binding CsgD family transcriptional regulator
MATQLVEPAAPLAPTLKLPIPPLPLIGREAEVTRAAPCSHRPPAAPRMVNMKMQPALERALALSDTYQAPPAQMSARSATSDGLTAREREIAGLMADRLSNREISGRLVMSEGTVEVHVTHSEQARLQIAQPGGRLGCASAGRGIWRSPRVKGSQPASVALLMTAAQMKVPVLKPGEFQRRWELAQ